jgi:hypothetical protein
MWWFERKNSGENSTKREELLRHTLENSTIALTTLSERLRGAMSNQVIITHKQDNSDHDIS